MTDYLYNENTVLSAMVTAQPALLLTLSHFGIPLGFGDKTVAQVCREHNVEPAFFLLITQVYTDDAYLPSQAVIKNTPMANLITYLVNSHDYYLNRGLPHIQGHLIKIAAMLPSRAAKAIKQFFLAYVEEVRAHFSNEEQVVYPHIEHLLNSQAGDNYTIKDYLDHHDNLDDKLSDLVQIIFKYLPAGENDDNAIDMIFDILQLSRDLRKHSLVEEKILGPYVKHLEKQHSAR